MDQLDILKENWNQQQPDYPKYSKDKITAMLARKSTSIVRWLLIIAIIEFVILSLLNVIPGMSEYHEQTIALTGSFLYYAIYIIHYAVIFYFIYLFYNNYKRIESTQPTRELMQHILTTRRTMKWYIWYNLGYIFITGIIISVVMLVKNPELAGIMNQDHIIEHQWLFYAVYFIFVILVFGVISLVFYGIYSLIYGILLRRLQANYNELKRMEV